MRFQRMLGTSALVLALISFPGVASAANGASPPEDVPDGMEWDPDRGLLEDPLRVDARLGAWLGRGSEDKLLETLRAQEKMDDILPRVRDRYDDFVDVYWTEGGSVVGQFTTDAPNGAVELLGESGANVMTERVRFSRDELEQFRADVVATLREISGDGKAARWVVAVDPRGQRIVVTVASDALKDGLQADLPARSRTADIEVDVAKGDLYTDFATRGGAEVGVNNTFACTSGFSVFEGGVEGVATAGHCTNNINKFVDPFAGVSHKRYISGWVHRQLGRLPVDDHDGR